jgi:ATP-dependent DNA helicase RecG
LIDQLITIVGAIAQTQIIRVGAEQIELVDYPDDVLREIFANAFAHRDWEASGLVEIIHSPAEMSGLGFDRIFREIGKLGKEPPVLEDGPRFRVVLPGGAGDEAFARFLRSEAISDTLAEDVDVLMALTALRNSRSVNATTLSPRLQRNVGDAQRVLERMQSASLVHPTRGTARRAHPNYTLTPTTVAAMRSAITYRTSTVDHDDQKLLRHLKRHGRITNEDVRNYLDCDVETARNRLTRLRRRGVIDFAPDAPRRGAFVEYVLVRESERSLPERPAPKPSVDQPALFDGDV